MFSVGMSESKNGKVIIDDIHPQVFKQLLQYLQHVPYFSVAAICHKSHCDHVEQICLYWFM
jgi:hypothetical protein